MGDVGALQALLDAKPANVLSADGRRPAPDEAQTEFDDLPPPHLPYASRGTGAMRGAARLDARAVCTLAAPGGGRRHRAPSALRQGYREVPRHAWPDRGGSRPLLG